MPSKALLCLHGTGASAEIFRMQLARFRRDFKDKFDFIFVDAPYPAAAGPGVLPTYAGAGPFRSWFDGNDADMGTRLDAITPVVKEAIDQWNATKDDPQAKIVGALSFSEGALVTVMLLWQQQRGLLSWLPALEFAVLMCCFYHDEVGAWMLAEPATHGSDRARITVPTLHVIGKTDFCLARAKKLITNHYDTKDAITLEFPGGHHVPSRPEDCRKVITRMRMLASETSSE